MRRHHPDLAPPPERAAATRRIQEVNVAYGLVRDPDARARYDRMRLIHLGRERVQAPARAARRKVERADRDAAEQWEALLRAAGVWGSRWWRRNRGLLRSGAMRVRRTGLDLAGRVLWLMSCAVWMVVGGAGAAAVQRLLEADGFVAPLVGVFGGLYLGSRRGWRRRLALVGMDPADAHRVRGAVELAAAVAVVTAAAALDLVLS